VINRETVEAMVAELDQGSFAIIDAKDQEFVEGVKLIIALQEDISVETALRVQKIYNQFQQNMHLAMQTKGLKTPIGKAIMIAIFYPHIGLIMAVGYLCSFMAKVLGVFHTLFLDTARAACKKAYEKNEEGLSVRLVMIVADFCLCSAYLIGVFYFPIVHMAVKAFGKAAKKIDREVPKERA